MNVQIRPATKADSGPILDVLKSTFTHTWLPALSDMGREHARDIDQRLRGYGDRHWMDFYVAELNEQVVGMAHWRDNFLDALHISHAHQGTGAGSMLLAHAIGEISKAYDEVRLETDTFNAQARGFYAKHGFEEVDTYPDEEWHSGFTTVLMVRRL
ncbi:N-acetyltransferase family protein [Maritalea sp.]|uniref:GNAT family N-acetyltransferase n=1 Tax=Maritalea sp. TaxID=2003361 RepID=UPI003EFB272D